MNQQIFISHSSVQKPYVEELIQHISCDYAVVDKYTFESACELRSEIRAAIKECGIFLYLISKESLTSAWVAEEISFVRDLVDENQIIFCPVIIDADIAVQHEGIKKWIRDTYLTNSIVNPTTLARLLKKKIQRNIWENYPDLKKREHLFLGRDSEMHSLAESYYSMGGSIKTCLIVSGLPHVGRKRLIREFVSSKVFPGGDPWDLIEVRLSDRDSIEDFVIQLNDIVQKYKYVELLDVIKEKQSVLNVTVQLLNMLHDANEHIVIHDDKCIVRGDGLLTQWFLDILNREDLKPGLQMNVASRFTPRPTLSSFHPTVFNTQIHPLKSADMKTLFNAYATLKGVEVSSQTVSSFIDQFVGFPEQVFFAVDTIAASSVKMALNEVKRVANKFDNNYQSIVLELKKDDRSFQILILLSKFEFISYEYLSDICGEDITDVIEKFHYYSLIETFGSARQYVSLNSAIVDYIRRNFKSPSLYAEKLRETTRKAIRSTDDGVSDISFLLHAAKENLKSNAVKVNEHYLIPSFVLKVIVEEYSIEKNDDNVISLADRILKGYNRQIYEDVTRNITYWLCCSLCRKRNSRFFEEVKYFESSPYSYNFLNGFYYRHTQKYSKAKGYYQAALSSTKACDEDSYVSKAEHELVLVCMILEEYEEALALAEQSYKKNPSNAYHIEAYFRCLVRSPHPAKDDLMRLMKEMHHSFGSNHEIIHETMKAEYSFYREGNFTKAIEILQDMLQRGRYIKYTETALRDICQKRDAMQIYKTMMSNLIT